MHKPVTEVERKRWQSLSQEGEFEFHKHNLWRQSQDFTSQTDELFRHFGFQPGQFRHKTIVDIGSGSRLRSKWFQGANIIAIEPLADRFITEIEWCDLRDAMEIYSVPAEERIEALVNRVDFVLSINVLDHCFNFEDIVANMRAYLTPNGEAFLSFDKHEIADELHPLELNEDVCQAIFERNGFKIINFSTGLGESIGHLQTYGHGPYALNYWLKPA